MRWGKVAISTSRARRILLACSSQEVEDGMFWYQRAHQWCDELAQGGGLQPAQVAGIVAALSPECSWERNLIDTEALVLGTKAHGFSTYGANVRKAKRILGGEKPSDVLGGRKVSSFYQLISNPSDGHTVCVDRHALNVACGYPFEGHQAGSFLKSQYDRVADVYRKIAKKEGILPHQVQAITWVHWRNRKEKQDG